MTKLTVFPLLLLAGFAWTASLSPLQITGPDSNRIRLIIAGDGFTINHQEFYKHCTDTLINAIFSGQPFKTYKNLFNIYRLNTISPDSGISDDFGQYYIENSFNTCATAIGTLATDTSLFGDTLRMFFQDWSFQSKNSFALLIANSFASVVDGYKLTDNTTAIGFRVPLQKTGPNKFGQLLGNLDSRLSVFKVQDIESIILRLHQEVKLYDAFSPTSQTPVLRSCSDTFSVKMDHRLNLSYSAKWYLDGREITGANGFSYILSPETKAYQSPREIKCRFRDVSNFKYSVTGMDSAGFNAFVIPSSIMTDSIAWTLQSAVGTEKAGKIQVKIKPFLGLQRSENRFEITVASPSSFQLAIYDVQGRLIRMLGQGNSDSAEKYSFQPKSAGVYIARLYTRGKCLSKIGVMAD